MLFVGDASVCTNYTLVVFANEMSETKHPLQSNDVKEDAQPKERSDEITKRHIVLRKYVSDTLFDIENGCTAAYIENGCTVACFLFGPHYTFGPDENGRFANPLYAWTRHAGNRQNVMECWDENKGQIYISMVQFGAVHTIQAIIFSFDEATGAPSHCIAPMFSSTV